MIDLDLAEHNAFQNAQQDVFKLIKDIPDIQKEETKVFIEQVVKLGIDLMKQQVYIELMCEDD
jgi:hypothetical protein